MVTTITGHLGITSNYLENKIKERMFLATTPLYEPPEVKYVALYNNPDGTTDYDTGDEIYSMFNDYQRFRISASSIDSRFVISGSTAYNQEDITWGPVSSALNYGTLYGWGIRDSLSGGNLLFWGLFDTSLPRPSSGMLITIGEGKMKISLSCRNKTSGGWTSLAATKIINWLTNGSSVAPIPWNPSNGMKIALGRNIVFDAGNNFVSWTECSEAYTDYTQQVISASSWQMASNGVVSNIEEIVFTEEAVGNWSTISDIVLYDNTSASALYWGHLTESVTVIPGDQFKISAGSIQVTYD